MFIYYDSGGGDVFICNTCLKETYVNNESLLKSIGKCEICHSTEACNDIQSTRLEFKNGSIEYINPVAVLV